MEWYIPISLLPGIALIILSTSNFIIALNNEVKELKQNRVLYKRIITLKITQLKRLSLSISSMYVSALAFTIIGLLSWFSISVPIVIGILIFAIFVMTFAVLLLVSFAIRAIKVRDLHLNIQ